jgi:DNA-directed RNA polymerases I, II, and III subunit RPABC1
MERLWRVNRTLLEKLSDTGYEVPEAERQSVSSLAAFQASFPEALTEPASMERKFLPRRGTMAELRAPNGVYLAFDIVEGKHILTAQINRLLTALQGQNVTTAFYVVNKPVYHKAAALLRASAGIYRIVVFRQEQLAFNVTHHLRVPRHELLTPAEASAWLALTQLKRSEIPRLFEDDPQARYHDAQPTELMRVTNPSPTIGSFTRMLVVVRRLLR